MRAISLWQPWASLWLSIYKVHETRHWKTNHRGPLLVHAAKKMEPAPGLELDELCIEAFGADWRVTLPRGALLGRVDLVGCKPTTDFVPIGRTDSLCGNFGPGRYGWRRGRFELLRLPIPYLGKQGIFTVPDHITEGEWP